MVCPNFPWDLLFEDMTEEIVFTRKLSILMTYFPDRRHDHNNYLLLQYPHVPVDSDPYPSYSRDHCITLMSSAIY